MGRPIQYNSVADVINKYLTYNQYVVEKHIDGRYYRKPRKEVVEELSQLIEAYEESQIKVYMESRKFGELYGI